MQMQITFTTSLVKWTKKKTLAVPHLSCCCLPARSKLRFIPSPMGKLLNCRRKPTLSRLSPSPALLHQSPPFHLIAEVPPLRQQVETRRWEVKRRRPVQQLLLQCQQNPLSRLKVTTLKKQAAWGEETDSLRHHPPLPPPSSPPLQPPLSEPLPPQSTSPPPFQLPGTQTPLPHLLR